jgi:hypothetical protein
MKQILLRKAGKTENKEQKESSTCISERKLGEVHGERTGERFLAKTSDDESEC